MNLNIRGYADERRLALAIQTVVSGVDALILMMYKSHFLIKNELW